MAEGVGFEPTGLSTNGFQDRRIKPLCHPSREYTHYSTAGRSGLTRSTACMSKNDREATGRGFRYCARHSGMITKQIEYRLGSSCSSAFLPAWTLQPLETFSRSARVAYRGTPASFATQIASLGRQSSSTCSPEEVTRAILA